MKPLLILLLSSAFAIAQESSVSLRIMAFPRIADDSPVELLVGGKTIEVKLASNRLSDAISVPAQESWNFGQITTNAEGKPTFDSWGLAKALESKKQIIILLHKGKQNSDGFRVIPINDGTAHFKGGQFLFYNLALQPIAAEIGGVRFTLDPAKHRIISPKADQGENLCHARILLKKDEKWRTFMESNWPLRDNARGIIILYTDPASSKVGMHSIRDFL